MSNTPTRPGDNSPGRHVVLIISPDAVAAALLGALVETLGYLVRFYRPPGSVDDELRSRPSVAMVDCHDPTQVREDLLGRARMRGISVVIFGTPDALRRVRELADEHAIATLMMPTTAEALDETLRRAVAADR
jgi:DNA-binding NtrC family response regulator